MKRHFHLRAAIAALLVNFAVAMPHAALAISGCSASTCSRNCSYPSSRCPSSAVTTEKVTVDNPYGLDALWKEGDFVSKTTLIILGLMSIGSWYIVFTKLYEQHLLAKQAKAANATFWTGWRSASSYRKS